MKIVPSELYTKASKELEAAVEKDLEEREDKSLASILPPKKGCCGNPSDCKDQK